MISFWVIFSEEERGGGYSIAAQYFCRSIFIWVGAFLSLLMFFMGLDDCFLHRNVENNLNILAIGGCFGFVL